MAGGDPGGGSIALAELIEKHGDALVDDLRVYSSIDLRDLFIEGSRVSPRLVLNAVRHLPLGSSTVAEMLGGPEFRGWGISEYQRADLIDATNSTTYAVVAANAKKKPKKPEPAPRPRKQQQVNLFSQQASAMFAKKRSARGG